MSSEKGLVVVTGASSGIGAAVARRFAERGHPVLALARRVDRLHELQLPPENSMCAQVDVTKLEEVTNAVKQAEERFGPADLLVNNAGVMLLGVVDDSDPSAWDKMMQTNVIGVLNGIRAVIGGMKERRRGTILNVSSVAGRKSFPNHAVYCGSKFAVHVCCNFCWHAIRMALVVGAEGVQDKTLALACSRRALLLAVAHGRTAELVTVAFGSISETVREECSAFNVRVGIIAPGVVDTELLAPNPAEVIEAYKRSLPSRLRAEDVADAVAYAYDAPPSVCIREILLAPTAQTS